MCSRPAYTKGDNHVLYPSVPGPQGQRRKTRQEAAPPCPSKELLAEQNPRIEGKKEEVIRDTRNICLRERYLLALLPRREKNIMSGGVINHLSYSQISTYLTCPLRYKHQYVDLVPPAFTSSALVFGQAIHEAVGAFYQEILTGEELRPDQMLDVYRQAWKSRDGAEIRFFNGDNEDSLQEKAGRMLNVFRDAFDPDVRVVGIEEFFEVQLANEVPPFQGYIDLIEDDQYGGVTVADLKTASKKLTGSSVHSNLQLTAYSLGASALGFDPDQLTFRLDVLTKTKSPELVRYETTRTESERERFVKLVKKVWAAIEHHAFFPREDWHCAQCAWADHCREW